MELNVDTFNRLSLGIMEQYQCQPAVALSKLKALTLNLHCGEEIYTSLPLQAALLTAVNTGKRAFLGKVYVMIQTDVPCLLRWPGNKYLHEIVEELGGIISVTGNSCYPCLFFGAVPSIVEDPIQVICNNWQAGIWTEAKPVPFCSGGTIPTAGIFAGAYAVFLVFLRASGIHLASCDKSRGISLWRPDLDWLCGEAEGPSIISLPKKYWILGLGHLGQAYLWNIALLPYPNTKDVSFLLQDDDVIVSANWSAGLLTEKDGINLHKTRLCSRWLEERKFLTKITERRFDKYTHRVDQEPFIALCGFDSATSRVHLENAGFDLILEAGLGGDVASFDRIAQHCFPCAPKTPAQIWGDETTDPVLNERVLDILQEADKETCGILSLTLAGKAVSASFVGACTGALVTAELIRGLHAGCRYDKISLQLRALDNRVAVLHHENYRVEQARNGSIFLR
jgi:hypothetical protein